MAEVFGVIGAGVGVAAAAGQLIDGIIKLHSFCSQIQNIPNDIQNAVDELATIVEVLEYVQIEMAHGTLPLQPSNHLSSMKVLSNLQESSQQIGEVLEDMRIKLGEKKYWGRIKAVGLTRKLEKAAKRVENAQRMVLILLAVENRISFRQNIINTQSVQREVTTISTHILSIPIAGQSTSNPSRDSRAIEDIDSSTITDKSPDIPGLASRQLRQRTWKAKGRNTASIKLRLPYFFLSPVWEFSVYKANQGWDFSLRSYNIRPRDAPIFEAIRKGDLIQVHELIYSGNASIEDRDPSGLGVLHYAALYCRKHGSKILEYLMKSGADIYDVDFAGFPAYYLFNRLKHVDGQQDLNVTGAYKLFMNHRDWIPSHPRTWVPFSNCRVPGDIIEMFPIFHNPPEEIIHSVLYEMWPPWKDMSPTDRMKTLFPDRVQKWPPTNISDTLSGTAISPLCIRACLSRSYIQETFASWGIREKNKLIKYAFNALAKQLSLGAEKEIEEARLFLRDMHITNSLVDTLKSADRLFYFVFCYMTHKTSRAMRVEKFIARCQKGLNYYISELMLFGIDMATIIDIERETPARNKERRRLGRCHHLMRNWYIYDILAIDYGLKPEDWHMWLSNPLDEWAGEFWDMIDHPERAIPGAWED